jgi:hypothetical protein
LREGKIFLFSRKNSSKQTSKTFQLLEHYWLCGACSRDWMLTMDSEQGVQLAERNRRRFRNALRGQPPLPAV